MADLDHLLPAARFQPCFVAAAAATLPGLRQSFADWRDIPHLMLDTEAVDRRAAATFGGTGSGTKRVDFKRVFTQFAKSRLHHLEPTETRGSDRFKFQTPLAEGQVVNVEFIHKSGQGIGKLLLLSVGARWAGKAMVGDWQIPFFYGEGQAASWAYASTEDLRACLDAGASFLDVLLPPLTQAMRQSLALPDIAGGLGAATARQAVDAARTLARARHGDERAELTLIGLESRHAHIAPWQPPIDSQGRIAPHAAWHVRFRAPDRSATSVSANYLGPAWQLANAYQRGDEPALGESWLDSDEILQRALRDERFPRHCALTNLTLKHEPGYMPGLCWRIDMADRGNGQRKLAWADADSGELRFF